MVYTPTRGFGHWLAPTQAIKKIVIIYGDSHYDSTLAVLRAQLQDRLAVTGKTWSLDELRTLLIHVGQLEQAARDAEFPSALQCVTDTLAQIFYAAYYNSTPANLEQLQRALTPFDEVTDAHLTVKVPEGFAFYALFPEQYIAAALDWANQQDTYDQRVFVVGARSIGTTLSSLVCAALTAHGWNAQRLTTRPFGPPFERRAEIETRDYQGVGKAIIVDEGPGLSGSSMAAIAAALVEVGFSRDGIAFMPGHGGEPGRAGSEAVRAWWKDTPRFVAPLRALRWQNRTLGQCLAERTQELMDEPVERVEDIGGGLWRRFIYSDPTQFPAVAAAFECPKFLCVLRSGTAVLWKFAGLAVLSNGEMGAESAFQQMMKRAQDGWSPFPLAIHRGFVAAPWIEGRPLQSSDASEELLSLIGRYIGNSAQAPRAPGEQQEALKRMGEWLYWNTWEAFGEEVAQRTRAWSERALEVGFVISFPAYGDGRMAPHEWRQTEQGKIWKVDNCGHDTDHTIVGCQTLAWDVAGTIIEWNLNSRQSGLVLHALEEVAGTTFPAEFLRFHTLAYAAFRLGLFTMEQNNASATEQERIHAAIDFYREALLRYLE